MPEATEKTEAVVAVKGYDFDAEVLQAPGLVLVDFSAEWCGPCRLVAPLLEQVAEELVGRVKAVKIDVDKEPALAQRYGIVSLPTLALFKNGAVVVQKIGLLTKIEIRAIVTGNY